MGLLYRLMGAVARLSERMSHTRINAIPLNWAAMFGLGALLVAAITETRDAVVNGETPRPAPLAEVLAHRNTERNFVTVVGPVAHDILVEQNKKTGEVKRTWGIMVDPKGARAIFIEFEGPEHGEDEPKVMTVTGMLIPVESEVRSKLNEMGNQIEGVPIDTEFVIVAGRHPGSAALWITLTALSGIMLLLMGITFLRKYVVFQQTRAGVPAVPAAVIPSEGIEMRVTGRFVLDEKNAQRFLDVPAGMVTLETGELAFVSNIDASNKFMGMTTAKRAGLWAIVVQRDSLRDPALGTLYVGLAARPALRIHYREGQSGRAETAVLSFASEGEREAAIAELNKAAGYGLVR